MRGLERGDKSEVGLKVAGAQIGIEARDAGLGTRGSHGVSLFPAAQWQCEEWPRDRPPLVATSNTVGWRSPAGKFEPLATGRVLKNTVSQFSSFWRCPLEVRKSSRRSPGRPRLRGGGDGDGGAPAESAKDAEAAPRPAGVKQNPKPGDTTGSFPEKPRRRCSGWSQSCPRRCLRCPGRRPPSAAARRSPRMLAPRPAGRHMVGKCWLQGAARWESRRFSTSS